MTDTNTDNSLQDKMDEMHQVTDETLLAIKKYKNEQNKIAQEISKKSDQKEIEKLMQQIQNM